MNLPTLKVQRSVSTDQVWMTLYASCLLMIALTGLENLVVNTIFFFVLMGLLLTGSRENTLMLYIIPMIFFGYSNIKLTLVGGFLLENSTLTNLICLLITVKVLLFYWNMKIPMTAIPIFLLILYCTLSTLVSGTITSGITMLCSMIIAMCLLECFKEGNEKHLKRYLLCFLLAVVAEVIYGVLHNEMVEEGTWRAMQFSGVRDPNNMALHCNYVLALCAIANEHIKSRTLLWGVRIGLAAVVVCTLSFSGITSMLCIFLVSLLFSGRLSTGKTALLWVATAGMFAILLGNYERFFQSLSNSNNAVLGALGERLTTMSDSYYKGDYAQVTSGRTELWKTWWSIYCQGDFAELVLGSSAVYSRVLKLVGTASHNAYIDIFVRYGILGMVLFVLKLGQSFVDRVGKKQYLSVAMSVIMLVNLFARSLGISSALIYGLLI